MRKQVLVSHYLSEAAEIGSMGAGERTYPSQKWWPSSVVMPKIVYIFIAMCYIGSILKEYIGSNLPRR